MPFPVSITGETFGTSTVPEGRIEKAVEVALDFRPAGIVKLIDLKKPIPQTISNHGCFGRDGFTWEQTDRLGD